MDRYDYNKRSPWEYDDINLKFIKEICASTDVEIQKIAKKISILLWLEKRSNRALERLPWEHEHPNDWKYNGIRWKWYDTAHNHVWRSNCHSTALYLLWSRNIPGMLRQRNFINTIEWGDWNNADDIMSYNTIDEFERSWIHIDDWELLWKSLPIHWLVAMKWNKEEHGEDYIDLRHSFVILQKNEEGYLCFEQDRWWWSFRFRYLHDILESYPDCNFYITADTSVSPEESPSDRWES